MSKITADEFKRRLEALCLSPGGRGLPRKRRDWDILFKSITLALEPGRDYSEKEVNQIVEEWLADIGQAIEIDHVTLRRHLVDTGYLIRDLAGTSYRVGFEAMADLFEPATDTVDPLAVIEEARRRKEQRKRQYLESTAGRRPHDRKA
jgi:hypothetical protein